MTMVANRFETWKTVELGGGPRNLADCSETINDYNQAPLIQQRTKERKLKIQSNALHILKRITLSNQYTRIHLVRVSLKRLELGREATRRHIYERAKEFGLTQVPLNTGVDLRLQYFNQPAGEQLLMGMEPIKLGGCYGDGGSRDIFFVSANTSMLYLGAVCGNPDSYWSNQFDWLFMYPLDQSW